MEDFGKIRSKEKPDEIIIDDFSVWVHSDIKEIHEVISADASFDGYELAE